VGQSWWNFENGVWGRFGGIVKTFFGAYLVEFLRLFWGRFGGIVKTVCGVWGKVGGIVKAMCWAELVEL
jgi:hypothetical protein